MLPARLQWQIIIYHCIHNNSGGVGPWSRYALSKSSCLTYVVSTFVPPEEVYQINCGSIHIDVKVDLLKLLIGIKHSLLNKKTCLDMFMVKHFEELQK